ncbi:MAG: DMT family transporter [Actinomycetota bacterium]|nr:DMT family transporter [Actinomycetota bacterium]
MPDLASPAPVTRPGSRPAWPGYLLVLTGAACFVVNAGVSKVVLTAGVEPAQLTALRCTGTALGLLLLLVATGRTRGPGWWPTRRELPLLLGYGLVGVALLQWTYFVAIDRLPVGIALLLEYTAPVLIALWARTVGREPVRPTVWLALALSLVGLAMVARVWDSGYLDALGVVAALAAAVCFATYFLLGERGVRDHDPLALSFWGFAVAAVFWSLVRPPWESFSGGIASTSAPLLGALSGLPEVPVWILVLWVVLLGTLVPFAAGTAALQYLPATVVSVVAMTEPVGVTLLGWAWFGEALRPVQVVGAGVVLTAVVLGQLARRAPREALPVPPA